MAPEGEELATAPSVVNMVASGPRNGWEDSLWSTNRCQVTTMDDPDQANREAAYFIWKREGCPNGRSTGAAPQRRLITDPSEPLIGEEEKIMADRPDANWPALLTNDVHGG